MKKIIITVLLFALIDNLYAQKVNLLNINLSQYTNVRDFCVSENGNEAFLTIQSTHEEIAQIVTIKRKKGKWSNPKLLPFCDEHKYMEPFLSKDSNRLYFASNRPKKENDSSKSNFDIWYVERKDEYSEWSTPVNMGQPINTENDEFYPSLADNGNLYFTMDSQLGMGKDDIYFSKWNGTEYEPPAILNNNINSDGYEFNAFISGDESFLIFTKYKAKDGIGSGDLYISRKNNITNNWQPAENLGSVINTPYMEYCPFYDNKTNILYFTSKRNNLVSKKFKNIQELEEYISKGENGNSKIYYIKMKL